MGRSKETKRLPQIDALRGLAALYVLFYHFDDGANPNLLHAPHSQHWIQAFFENDAFHRGHWAVQLFFCASGFLVFSSLSRRSGVEKRPFLNFYVRRMFRILPLWWTLLFILFAFGQFQTKVLLANLFFLFGFVSYIPAFVPVAPAWSLFVEEVFYVSLPLLMNSLKRKGAVIFYFLLATFVAAVWKQKAASWGVPETASFIQFSPLAQFQFFFLGIAIKMFLDESAFRTLGGIWLDVLVLFSFLAYWGHVYIPNEFTVPLFFIACLVPGTLVGKLVNNPLLRRAGVLCYGIYLIHFPLLRSYPFTQMTTWLHLQSFSYEARILILFPVDVALCMIIAELSYRFLESPSLKFGGRLVEKRERMAEPAPVRGQLKKSV